MLLAAMAVLAGCGGSDDEEPAGLSDEQNAAISEAVLTIEDQCSGLGAGGASYGAQQISESVDTLTTIYRETPEANYSEPGRTESVTLQDVLQDSQDTLRAACPIKLIDPADTNAITDVILDHATSD